MPACRRLWSPIVVALICSSSSLAAEVVEGGKVYIGPEGVEVTIVTVAPRSKNQAIIVVQGTDSELDGKALQYDVEGEGDRIDYKTKLHGRDYHTVYVRAGYSGARSFNLAVPGRDRHVALTFNDEKTKRLKADEAYWAHERQVKEGLLAPLQSFDRKAEQARHEKQAEADVASMNKACGTSIPFTIDWKAISDETILLYSVSSYCTAPVNALERLCTSDVARSTIKAKVTKVTCQFGKTMKHEIKGGLFTVVVEPGTANQEDLATEFFKKHL